ncbi:hypothetical protein [Labrys wisconsinensis]|uniref:Lipoprotein n=1 Tax=Labrys wisconsinensis TaxID=425677 RepID=A0ABU0JBX2_9HYPH|nr:hypothetical protein [Labrys wisconsinensis]MDQ0470908.1 hypothetical protein [Labrys wisconsinensis]
MRSVVISALAAAGLVACVSGALAHSNPRDFYAIQRGEPTDSTTAAPLVQQPRPIVHVRHAALAARHVSAPEPAGM